MNFQIILSNFLVKRRYLVYYLFVVSFTHAVQTFFFKQIHQCNFPGIQLAVLIPCSCANNEQYSLLCACPYELHFGIMPACGDSVLVAGS